jgi:hypothetical protein
VVAGLAVATGLIGVAPASAAVPGLQYVATHSGFDSVVYKSVTVSCPAGLRVVGAGFELTGAVGSVVLDDFIPSTTSVTVGAGEIVGAGEPSDGTTASWSVGATAVCASPPPGLQIVSQPSSFGPGGARQATATCPAGKQLIGAGSSLSNGFGQISVKALDISTTAATASAIDDEDGYSGPWSVSAYAVCADPLPGLQIVLASTDHVSTPTKVVTAACPAGKRALGAGWNLGASEQVLAIDAFIADGTGVTLSGSEDDNGFSGFWNLTAEAICADM